MFQRKIAITIAAGLLAAGVGVASAFAGSSPSAATPATATPSVGPTGDQGHQAKLFALETPSFHLELRTFGDHRLFLEIQEHMHLFALSSQSGFICVVTEFPRNLDEVSISFK